MGDYVVTTGRGGRFDVPGLGWWHQQHWYRYDSDSHVDGDDTIAQFRRASMRSFVVEDTRGREIGRFSRKSFGESGTLSFRNVDYELGAKGFWQSKVVLSRHGEELATFGPNWSLRKIEVSEPAGHGAPPGLLLFSAWVVMCLVRDRAGVAAT